jgi:hypothetical protein
MIHLHPLRTGDQVNRLVIGDMDSINNDGMADSPDAAVVPPLPELHDEAKADDEPRATAGGTSSGSADEEGNQDAASVKTTTADFFPDYQADAPSGSSSKQHKLGLDINEPWGWDGSSYNDYE